MASASRAKQLAVDEAAYIAGLIDGEGTITLTRLPAHENRRLVVSIASTEIQLLQSVVESFGAGKIRRKRASSSPHNPSFCYAVTSRQALSLLRQVLPYLRPYKFEHELLSLRAMNIDRDRCAVQS
ncbi:MAG: LAGLIDADG family homing endonuclease [Pseudomonadota bacterium]